MGRLGWGGVLEHGGGVAVQVLVLDQQQLHPLRLAPLQPALYMLVPPRPRVVLARRLDELGEVQREVLAQAVAEAVVGVHDVAPVADHVDHAAEALRAVRTEALHVRLLQAHSPPMSFGVWRDAGGVP